MKFEWGKYVTHENIFMENVGRMLPHGIKTGCKTVTVLLFGYEIIPCVRYEGRKLRKDYKVTFRQSVSH